MRTIFLAANWKMNTNRAEGVALVKELSKAVERRDGLEVALCPPSVYLQSVVEAAKGSLIRVGGQNCYFEPKGAFTGEVSPQMLVDVGCEYVILGHSERRHVFGESDELIAKKVVAALAAGLKVILCVGELLAEREAGNMQDVVRGQIEAGLADVNAGQMASVTVAYEPVWAIGTGRTATPEDANEVHVFIRKLVGERFGQEVSASLTIQYGGSVKPDNAFDLLSQSDIDGSLVGGAGLKVDSFAAIIEAAVQAKKLA